MNCWEILEDEAVREGLLDDEAVEEGLLTLERTQISNLQGSKNLLELGLGNVSQGFL